MSSSLKHFAAKLAAFALVIPVAAHALELSQRRSAPASPPALQTVAAEAPAAPACDRNVRVVYAGAVAPGASCAGLRAGVR